MKELYRVKAKDDDPYSSRGPVSRLVVGENVEDAIEKFRFVVQYGHTLTILSVAHLGEVIV